jgi:hypothetical protein
MLKANAALVPEGCTSLVSALGRVFMFSFVLPDLDSI